MEPEFTPRLLLWLHLEMGGAGWCVERSEYFRESKDEKGESGHDHYICWSFLLFFWGFFFQFFFSLLLFFFQFPKCELMCDMWRN